MSTAPPARPRRANLALIAGLIVFATGVAFFLGTRLAGGGTAPATAAPSDIAAATIPPADAGADARRPSRRPRPTPAPSLEQLIGQKLVVRMAGTRAVGGAPRAGPERRDRRRRAVRRSTSSDEEQLAAATRTLQAAAAAGGQPPLLIAVDQEGGGIRRLPWAQPAASATRMGRMEPDEVRSIGAATGQALAAVGANVDLAPVADVPRRRPVVHARRATGRSRTTPRSWRGW